MYMCAYAYPHMYVCVRNGLYMYTPNLVICATNQWHEDTRDALKYTAHACVNISMEKPCGLWDESGLWDKTVLCWLSVHTRSLWAYFWGPGRAYGVFRGLGFRGLGFRGDHSLVFRGLGSRSRVLGFGSQAVREDPKSRSLNGGSYKVPLAV